MTAHKMEFSLRLDPRELQYLPNLPTANSLSPVKQYNELEWYVNLMYNAPEDCLSVYFMNKQVEDKVPVLLWGDYVYCLTYGEGIKEAKIHGNIISSNNSMAFFCTAPNMSTHLDSEGVLKLSLEITFLRFQSYRLEEAPFEDVNIVHLRLDCGKDIFVSKTLLAHHSPFFANMFKYTQFKEEEPKVYQIHRVKYKTVLMILHAIYGLDIYPLRGSTPEEIYEALTLCDQWLCDSAARAIESGILKSDSTALDHLLSMADKFRMFNLVEEISRNMSQATLKSIVIHPFSVETLRVLMKHMQEFL